MGGQVGCAPREPSLPVRSPSQFRSLRRFPAGSRGVAEGAVGRTRVLPEGAKAAQGGPSAWVQEKETKLPK